jgi:hypothetical protein
MSGSPVAASALTFLDAGIITAVQTFTMIIGSRMGASFIILFIGFIYVLARPQPLHQSEHGVAVLHRDGHACRPGH